jgi:hypothetical protein
MTADELEQAMQRVAEARLNAADEWLWVEDEGEHAGLHDTVPDGPELAGPYCGCTTCIVREVLDAAWPYAYRLAHADDVEEPVLP